MLASTVTPSAARDRWVGPAIAGAAGFLAGAAIASTANARYYDPYWGYHDPSWGAAHAYTTSPYYGDGYAPPVYAGAAAGYGTCWIVTDKGRNFGYYGSCSDAFRQPTLDRTTGSRSAEVRPFR
jgi:hypothetical protein